jgi:hypothetical protein
MFAVLFAVCYQSVHTFSHKHHLKTTCSDDSHHVLEKTAEKTFTESDDCPICEFKFVAFLAPEVLHFECIASFYKIPYQFNSNASCITFDGNSFYLRGPPVFMA